MNATLIMAFILILIVVATVITKKLPFNWTFHRRNKHFHCRTARFHDEICRIYAFVCISVFPDAYRSWCIRYDRFCYHNKTRKQDECNCYYGSDNPHRRFQYPDR